MNFWRRRKRGEDLKNWDSNGSSTDDGFWTSDSIERPFPFLSVHGLSPHCDLGSFHYENAGISLAYGSFSGSEYWL